jgi:D-alanyl-D-alanine dipeptidase
MALRPWSSIPIVDNDEPLLALPAEFLRLEPHPYRAVGAPYGDDGSPFRLRSGVIERLQRAQQQLREKRPGWRLAIFDAWRPLEVQAYMVEHTIAAECARLRIDAAVASPQREAVLAEVGRFWAPPSADPATTPPHSTGAAIDLTLADASDAVVEMGSEIDALGAVSEPDHYLKVADGLPDGELRRQVLCWHGHRLLLAEAMAAAGFVCHPNEWWHFSWGDQLWAWRSGQPQACYGRWLPG